MMMLKKILNYFREDYQRVQIEKYLSQSIDHYDLEQRQKRLAYKGIY